MGFYVGFCIYDFSFWKKFFLIDYYDILRYFLLQVLESYERAYVNMIRVQQLSELEEVCSIVFENKSTLFLFYFCIQA
jgi:hypothetical protein